MKKSIFVHFPFCGFFLYTAGIGAVFPTISAGNQVGFPYTTPTKLEATFQV